VNFGVVLRHPKKLREGVRQMVLVQCRHTCVYMPVYLCHLEQHQQNPGLIFEVFEVFGKTPKFSKT
jgi:hypothetical protein